MRRLALFDLDGTLTRGDTFRGFVLQLLLAHPARWLRTPLLAIPVAGFMLKLVDRGRLKGSIINLLFGGLTRAQMQDFAPRYAEWVLANYMFPEGLAALRGHLAAGDHVVLLSASPDLYVHDIGKLLGVTESFCTQIRWDGDRLDGRLAGPNHRDQQKARVLASLRAANPGLPVIAYGNSSPDLDHMRLCEEAVYVNAGRHAARLSTELPAIRCVQWGSSA